MTGLPQGTLTFLLTDLQGSTRTWEAETSAMREAMVVHDLIMYEALGRYSGAMVESGREGGSILAAFTRAHDAAMCAVSCRRSRRAPEIHAAAADRCSHAAAF